MGRCPSVVSPGCTSTGSGFARLGHEVWYVEDDAVWLYDPEQNAVTDDCSYAIRHLAGCLERVGLPGQWAMRFMGREDACWGLSAQALNELYRSCDALLNIGGATDLVSGTWRRRSAYMSRRTQSSLSSSWPTTTSMRLAFANHHTIVTYGENYGARLWCASEWHQVWQDAPTYRLDHRPMAYDPAAPYFTTIGNYRHAGNDVTYRGETYRWSKHYEWEKFIDLPQRSPQPFELAMMVQDPEDAKLLETHGWKVVSPFAMSLDVFGTIRIYPSITRRIYGGQGPEYPPTQRLVQ